MLKEKLIRGFKISIIILLILAIALVSFPSWKSDLIVRGVLTTLQSRLNDTLAYNQYTWMCLLIFLVLLCSFLN